MAHPVMKQLLNGSSKDMTVNGSSTPVVFTYTADGQVKLRSLICVLKDEGSTSFGGFGSLSALTNGLLIEITQNGTTNTVATLKDNSDMCMMFSSNQFGNGAVLSILSVVTPLGFGETNDCFIGVADLEDGIILNEDDTFTVTVRDNLSNIDVLEMAVGVSVLC